MPGIQEAANKAQGGGREEDLTYKHQASSKLSVLSRSLGCAGQAPSAPSASLPEPTPPPLQWAAVPALPHTPACTTRPPTCPTAEPSTPLLHPASHPHLHSNPRFHSPHTLACTSRPHSGLSPHPRHTTSALGVEPHCIFFGRLPAAATRGRKLSSGNKDGDDEQAQITAVMTGS